MRILIVLNSSGFFPHFDTVVRELCEQGHAVKVITRMITKGDDDADYQREMVASVSAYEHGSYDFGLRKRQDRWKSAVRTLRGTLNYAIYFRAQHNSPQLGERLAPACPARLRSFFASRAGRWLISRDASLAAYRRLQAALPPDPRILRQVEAECPDVVVACPFVYTMSADTEYLRAARRLAVPTVAAVASWDNLSTKGAFHLLPDRVLVWNERLADEAALIHAIPRERIVSAGAAKFDGYFDLRATLPREDFCASIGLETNRPYLLYLGSSEQVAGDETQFVQELARCMAGDPRTSSLRVVVRPHPLNAEVWQGFAAEGITVFPRRGQRPDLPRHRCDYFNSLSHASAVFGVNTTAFLEAAIADRPCLSIVSDQHRQGQVERGHFHHLVEGGFLETVPDFEQAVAATAAILDGEDRRQAARRRFVESFVRPAGIDRPAGEAMAAAIVDAARGRRMPARRGTPLADHEGTGRPPAEAARADASPRGRPAPLARRS